MSLLVDRFGRRVDYVRLSVTDRCDFRCVYCMAEEMTFVPRRDVLTLEELLAVGAAFVSLGVRKIRLTGGEPLVRNNILWLAERLAALPGVARAARENGQTVLYSGDVAGTVGGLMALAEEAGVDPRNLGIRQATLEDVFLDLTGRALRD